MDVSNTLVVINSATNCFIYYAFSQRYRWHIHQFLRCKFEPPIGVSERLPTGFSTPSPATDERTGLLRQRWRSFRDIWRQKKMRPNGLQTPKFSSPTAAQKWHGRSTSYDATAPVSFNSGADRELESFSITGPLNGQFSPNHENKFNQFNQSIKLPIFFANAANSDQNVIRMIRDEAEEFQSSDVSL